MNIPNNLTISRAVLGLFIMFQVYTGEFVGALLLFSIAVFTDFLDGFIARRRHSGTLIGKLLDPIADKILVLGVLISFADLGIIPAWIIFLIFLRDITITGFRSFAAILNRVLAANFLNKVKSSLQYGVIGFTLFALAINLEVEPLVYLILFLIVALVTIFSGIVFIWQNRRILRYGAI